MHALTHSVPPILQQATTDTCLCRRLLDTHRQVWVSLLCGHCSFLLGPGVHKVLFVPPKSLFPLSCVNSVIKSHWPPKSNSLGFSVPLSDPQVGKSFVGPRTYLTVQEFVWYNCSAVCGSSAWQFYGGVNGNLLQEAYATCYMTQVCCTQSPCPCSMPLLTGASAGDTKTLKGRSGSVSVGFLGPGVHKVFLSPLSTSSGYGA